MQRHKCPNTIQQIRILVVTDVTLEHIVKLIAENSAYHLISIQWENLIIPFLVSNMQNAFDINRWFWCHLAFRTPVYFEYWAIIAPLWRNSNDDWHYAMFLTTICKGLKTSNHEMNAEKWVKDLFMKTYERCIRQVILSPSCVTCAWFAKQ